MEVIEIVRAKLTDKAPEALQLNFYIEEVAQAIKTYCNRTDIPSELAFTHANMVVDMIKNEKRKNDPEAQSSVASIREGDTTVQFGSAKVESRERATEKLLYDYSSQLNRFRKLRW